MQSQNDGQVLCGPLNEEKSLLYLMQTARKANIFGVAVLTRWSWIFVSKHVVIIITSLVNLEALEQKLSCYRRKQSPKGCMPLSTDTFEYNNNNTRIAHGEQIWRTTKKTLSNKPFARGSVNILGPGHWSV